MKGTENKYKKNSRMQTSGGAVGRGGVTGVVGPGDQPLSKADKCVPTGFYKMLPFL